MTPGESSYKLSPMKFLILLFIINIPVYAAPSIGTTEGCPAKAEVIASEGDKFVVVKLNGAKWKLTSTKPFSFQAKEPVTFRSVMNDPMRGDPNFEFVNTSLTMSSLPRLTISYSGRQDKCQVRIYAPVKK